MTDELGLTNFSRGGWGGMNIPTAAGQFSAKPVPTSFAGFDWESFPTDAGQLPSTGAGWFDGIKSSFSKGLEDWGSLSTFGGVDANGNKVQGKADYALGALGSLGQAFMAMQNYGLAKDKFNFQKDAWNQEFNAQKGLINSRLADRQRTRIRGGDTGAMSVDAYMAKYGVK